MKKRNNIPIYLALSLLFFSLNSCQNSAETKAPEYNQAAKELVDMTENNPEVKSLLTAAIERAKQVNPDKNTNPVQSLDEFYAFISNMEHSMPWGHIQNDQDLSLHDDMLMSFGYFYFVIDQPLPELEGRGYYNNSIQYMEPFSTWLVSFNKTLGKFLDTEESWSEAYYQLALKDESFGLTKDWYEDPSNWHTFNQFFSRRLKSPDKRPVAGVDDNSVVVSAADAVPQGVWSIDSNSYLTDKNGVRIKLEILNSIEQLIGEDSEFEQEFANGAFTHSFLSVNDYHHYHFPLGGTIREVRIIQAHNPIGATITWNQDYNAYVGDMSKTGWQSLETRGCIILETTDYGLVALLPIGMAVVGSVNFEVYIKPGIEVSKGDMMGHFLFGGSDFIMIFQEQAGFEFEAPMEDDGQSYEHLLVGEQIGSLHPKK